MTTRELFEKVNLVIALEERRFFNYLEDSINELRLRCGKIIYYDGYRRLLSKPENWDSHSTDYFELQSIGFVPAISSEYEADKRYEKTDEKDPLINIPPPRRLRDDLVVRAIFHGCILANILYLAGCGDNYKSEFLTNAELARRQEKSAAAKGARIKKTRW